MNAVAPVPDLCLTDLVHSGAIVGEPRVGSRRAWTTREVKVLREGYAALGLQGLVPALPGRSAGSIYQMAGRLELRPVRVKPFIPGETRWHNSDHIDAVIQREYPNASAKRDVAALAARVGRPRWWVSKRATQLGLAHPSRKPPAWSAAEIAILTEHASRKPDGVQRMLKRAGFARSLSAIVNRLTIEGCDRSDPDRVTGAQLASFLGLDGKTVTRWIDKGWIVAARASPTAHWQIHERDVARFIVENAALVDLRKIVDKFWFIDLLARHAREARIGVSHGRGE